MKTVLVFICLKAVEIAVAVFVPYGIGWVATRIAGEKEGKLTNWCIGTLCLCIMGAVFLGLYIVIPDFIAANWEWAKKLTN